MKQENHDDDTQNKLLEGLPTINIAAFFMPAIWGPANGLWITVLYYPLWLFADNLFYEAYVNTSPLTVGFALATLILLIIVTLVFAKAGQKYALNRALSMGKTKEQYIKSQKKWAVAMIIVAVVMILAATYYNLTIRPTLGF